MDIEAKLYHFELEITANQACFLSQKFLLVMYPCYINKSVVVVCYFFDFKYYGYCQSRLYSGSRLIGRQINQIFC